MLDPKCISKEYFCEMYPTCVSSKLCEFILFKLYFGLTPCGPTNLFQAKTTSESDLSMVCSYQIKSVENPSA